MELWAIKFVKREILLVKFSGIEYTLSS